MEQAVRSVGQWPRLLPVKEPRYSLPAAATEIIVSEQALTEASMDDSQLESRSLELKRISEPVKVRVMRGV